MVEHPLPRLSKIQKRIFCFLSKIELPVYLHSSVKKKSHITNASEHLKKGKTFKLDIAKFFPSTTQEQVFQFFNRKMHCSPDVSDILAKICTCNGHIPTGGSHSQILAFFTHKEMFDEIYRISRNNDLIMTCYCDDVTITGENLTLEIKNLIRKIIKKSGLKIKKTKERGYDVNDSKKITGVIIRKEEKRIPNSIHKKIHEQFHQLGKNSDDQATQKKELDRLRGLANYANQIRPSNWLTRIKKKEKELSRLK
ncbi:MAG: RNA-directed DNA polymerase [Proteobacteria bacterium]|nr:RNA-directed DNA polymerase [Pseudomonadota bacterium]